MQCNQKSELETREYIGIVSVVIPCYKQAAFLADAIESVLQQTYKHYEIIVINDGSPDNIRSIVEKYPDVRLIDQPNQGAAIARNRGIIESTGEYLIFLDADDRLLPDAMLTGIEYLAHNPHCAFVSGKVKLISNDGSLLEIPPQPTIKKDHYVTLLHSNYIWTPGVVVYHRWLFKTTAGFDPSAGAAADYELNIRVARQFAVGCHDCIILEYRIHNANMSGNLAYMLKSDIALRRRQWKYVKYQKILTEAWKEGIKIVQEDVGERLINETWIDLKHRRKGIETFKRIYYIFKYYPKGIPKRFTRRKDVANILSFFRGSYKTNH